MIISTENACSFFGGEIDKRWFCVQTHPKHEHIAAASLSKNWNLEVFNPMLRSRKNTRRGLVWFIESAFPGYIFVRFDFRQEMDCVRYCPGVSRIVRFKSGYPSIPEAQMNELRPIFDANETLVVSEHVSVGDSVRIAYGPLRDVTALVLRVMPAQQRVRALLEFLGGSTTLEVNFGDIVIESRLKPLSGLLNRSENFESIEFNTAG